MLDQTFARLARNGARFLFVTTLLLAVSVAAAPRSADLTRVTGRPDMQTPAPTGRIVIKLAPGSGLVMTDDGLTPRRADKAMTADRIEALVASRWPGARLEKRFPTAATNLDKAYRPQTNLPDLALYAHVETGTTDRAVLLRSLAALNADPAVAVAFLEPVAVPASLGFDAFTGATPAPPATIAAGDRDTPDFESMQLYLHAAPGGIGAPSRRAGPGARGAGLTIVDIEGAWLWAHEDLPAPAVDLGVHTEDEAWRYHGTAVIGEIRGTDNGLGVTGITPDCAVGSSSIIGGSTAEALAAAMDTLDAGDMILIELHGAGPNATGEGQFGYVPMEYWQDNFDVIRLATMKGILVIEAAGNGWQNLDSAIYLGLFDRSVRDSGAIMCGATAGGSLDYADFSNHGARVDLNGWGWDVTTCAYGDLRGAPLPEEQWYTSEFSGTSSASPIVTGAVAGLQGMVRSEFGFDLDARLARDLLRQTGTTINPGRLIGERPDLVAAFALAQTDIGQVTGTVADADTGQPLDGIEVKVIDQGGPVDGAFTASGTDGGWRLPLQTGPVTLEFSSFYHEAATTTVTVLAGQTLTVDIDLAPLPLVDLMGVVSGGGQSLSGAGVTPLIYPVDSATSDQAGNWIIHDVPRGYAYTLLVDGVPGYGARVMTVDTEGVTESVVLRPILAVISEDFETDDGGFTPFGTDWEHGQPPAAITGGAFSGDKVWGVGMSGSYENDIYSTLRSPIYDLSGVTSGSYYLSFHYLCATEPGYDGATVRISSLAGEEIVLPESGYTDLNLSGLDHKPGWSGYTDGWRGAVFDLTGHLNSIVFFTLEFGADGGDPREGFYIDGITFGEGASVSPAPDPGTPRPYAATLQAWPNPFNPRLTLHYSLTRAARLEVGVYDLRGRLVRTLLAAPVRDLTGALTWDGTDDGGRPAPSGVYLVRLQSSAGDLATRRVVLAK